jgi:hypothetical protein
MRKKTIPNKKRGAARPWTFEEVPIGAIIGYEEKTWSGSSVLRRSLITEAKKTESGVEVRFGGQHIDAKALVEGDYKLLRDGLEYPRVSAPTTTRPTPTRSSRSRRSSPR